MAVLDAQSFYRLFFKKIKRGSSKLENKIFKKHLDKHFYPKLFKK